MHIYREGNLLADILVNWGVVQRKSQIIEEPYSVSFLSSATG